MTNKDIFSTIDMMVAEGQLSYLKGHEVAGSRQFRFGMNDTVGYDAYVFMLVIDGEADVEINYNSVKLRQGMMLILKPYMLITSVHADDSFLTSCLFIDRYFFSTIPESVHFHALQNQIISKVGVPVVEFNSLELDEAKSVFASLCDFVPDYAFAAPMMLIRLSYLILIVMAAMQRRLETVSNTVTHKEVLFQKFLQLLCINYAEQHDLGFYAKELGVTVRYLQRIVKDITGRTVYSYISERLTIHARRLLACADMTVEEIAFALHFSSASAFSKFFKTNCGVSPKQFRDEVKANHKREMRIH